MHTVGISGIGFVGQAMMTSYQERGYKLGKNLFIYDKYKNGGMGSFEGLLQTDILFLTLPTVFDYGTASYDITPIVETVGKLRDAHFTGAVVLKSTVGPQTTEKLAAEYHLNLLHNPEFLTARTALEDFNNQKHIVLGRSETCSDQAFNAVNQFYRKHYPDAMISVCTATESESMKIFANVCYASKVQIFTEFYLLCQKMGISYETVKTLMIKNGWINPMHTIIPGPDGQISYGGLCFPKDTNALLHFMKELGVPCAVLEAVIRERDEMRDDHDNTNRGDVKKD